MLHDNANHPKTTLIILKLNCHSAAVQDKEQDHIHSDGGLWQPQNSSRGYLLIFTPKYKLAANCKLLLWAKQVFFHHLTVYA